MKERNNSQKKAQNGEKIMYRLITYVLSQHCRQILSRERRFDLA